MLQSLHVKNYILIDEFDVNFSNGFNVLSGETGAGKSIVIGSINAALGGRVSSSVIRKNAEFALIELLFIVESIELLELLSKEGIEVVDNELLISRKITTNRSIYRVNGFTITQQKVKEIAAYLINIHGQNEQQSLMRPQFSLMILDEYAKQDITDLKESFQETYENYIKTQKELEKFTLNEDERLRELSFLDYEIEEIEEANILENEEGLLMEQFKMLSHSKIIMEQSEKMNECLELAAEKIGSAIKAIDSIREYDDQIENNAKQLYILEDTINEVLRDSERYIHSIDIDEQTIFNVQSRLDLLHDIKRKYGQSYDLIIKYLENSKNRKKELIEYEENLERLIVQKNTLYESATILAKKMHDERKKYASVLSNEIKKALRELNFLHVEFEVCVTKKEELQRSGFDDIRFMISLNKGEAPNDIANVASGGELSRIMLAIKSVLASVDQTPTLIFDEIDTGISGRTAQKVAENISSIAKFHQIICISHLPQIVSMADAHYLIDKQEDEVTKTELKKLSSEEEIIEIARLLGGVSIGDLAYENAKEMKNMAFAFKEGQ